jgi:hypothetical protein
VLLSTGYIAGGAIAGVLIAFLSFSDTIPKLLHTWEYRQYTASKAESVQDLAREIAQQELRFTAEGRSQAKQSDNKSAGDAQEADAQRQSAQQRREALGQLSAQIVKLNADVLAEYVPVAAGTQLRLPKNETYSASRDTYLGDVAQQFIGSREKAQLLLNLNEDRLALPTELPEGAKLKIPQHTWPALAAFGALVVFLLVVSFGWLLQSAPLAGVAGGGDREDQRSATAGDKFGMSKPRH